VFIKLVEPAGVREASVSDAARCLSCLGTTSCGMNSKASTTKE
jgi:hypothetical protein